MTREEFDRKSATLAETIRRLDEAEMQGRNVTAARQNAIDELIAAHRARIKTIKALRGETE